MTALRVVTYNIHKCRGMDGRESPARIARVLREIHADVIALQEVLGHQADAIAADLNLPFALGENRRHQGAAYGNVVLTRFPIQATHNYDLSVEGREPRGCLRADHGTSAGVRPGAAHPAARPLDVRLARVRPGRHHQGRVHMPHGCSGLRSRVPGEPHLVRR